MSGSLVGLGSGEKEESRSEREGREREVKPYRV